MFSVKALQAVVNSVRSDKQRAFVPYQYDWAQFYVKFQCFDVREFFMHGCKSLIRIYVMLTLF